MDQELIAYLDTRFERMAGRMEGRFDGLETRMERMEGRIDGIESRLSSVEGRLSGVEDAVHQTQVMVEGVRDDIRQIAEGVIGTNERMYQVQGEVMAKIEEVGGLVKSLFTTVDSRLKVLESWKERTDRDPVEIVRERYGRPKA